MISYVLLGVKVRISVFSCEVTRLSERIDGWSWSVPTSTAVTCAISWARSIWENPHVDEPISRAIFDDRLSIHNSWKNPSSLPAERDTHSRMGDADIFIVSSISISYEAFDVVVPFTVTRPSAMIACALFREYQYHSTIAISSLMHYKIIVPPNLFYLIYLSIFSILSNQSPILARTVGNISTLSIPSSSFWNFESTQSLTV